MTALPVAERLSARLIRMPNGCLEWTGYTNDKGYGRIWVGPLGAPERMRYAHRVAWELVNGLIPDDLCVLHRCDNPPCANVTHLFLGTRSDNNADMLAKGRHGMVLRTHCPQGHPYDEANTLRYNHQRLNRLCRICLNARRRERKAAKVRALRADWLATDNYNSRKTHCPQGHPYDEANTYLLGTNRQCRQCNRAAGRRYKSRKRAERNANGIEIQS